LVRWVWTCSVASPQRRLITDAVVVRAKTLSNLAVYRGEIDTALPTIPNSDRVGRYAVIYPLGGSEGPDPILDDSSVDLTYGFQINCAAGFVTDAEFLYDQVYALFNRWTPTVTGLVFGSFRPPAGYQPGPARRNDQVQPPRFWLPGQFQIVATTA
jgi:hypothetical protein